MAAMAPPQAMGPWLLWHLLKPWARGCYGHAYILVDDDDEASTLTLHTLTLTLHTLTLTLHT